LVKKGEQERKVRAFSPGHGHEREKRENSRQHALRGNKCEEPGCNSRRNLDFSHIKHTPILDKPWVKENRFNPSANRGMKNRVLDIRKYPDRYKLMDRSHNRLFDNWRKQNPGKTWDDWIKTL